MTPQPLPLKPETATDRMARYFRERRGQWVNIQDLVHVGGPGAWRTEISRCRRQFGMQFRNRITRDANGKVLVSEYRLVGDRGQDSEAA